MKGWGGSFGAQIVKNLSKIAEGNGKSYRSRCREEETTKIINEGARKGNHQKKKKGGVFSRKPSNASGGKERTASAPAWRRNREEGGESRESQKGRKPRNQVSSGGNDAVDIEERDRRGRDG